MVMAGISLFNNMIDLTAVYFHSNNSILWETKQDSNNQNLFYTTPVNLGPADSYGAQAEINLNPVKPWRLKLSGRLEIIPEDITLDGIYYGKTRLRQYYAMYNTFAFNHGWGGMLNIMAEPTFKTYDRTYHTVYNVGGQLYKMAYKNKLQLSLTFNALGDRRRYDRYANGNNIAYDYITPIQSVGISIVWRFSGGKQVSVNAVNGALYFREMKDVR